MAPALHISGQRTFLLGVNYWSRAGGPRMWERFDEAVVRAELRQMASIGLNTCRSFNFIPSIMLEDGNLDQNVLQRMHRFFDLCQQEGMTTIPTALVGHMSGENYDFSEQDGRDVYSDEYLVVLQQKLMRAIGKLGAEHPAVIAYLASNEMPLWGGKSQPKTIARWAKALRDALHDVDDRRPFGIGDGVMNLKGGQNGFDVDTLRDVVDFVGPHTYYSDSDPYRQAMNAEYCIRSLSYLGLPVVFEEFGGSSAQVSEANRLLYYREAIHSCLTSGASGALGWCYSDFDLVNEAPYVHHAFELGFGIVDAKGEEKPVCRELKAIRALIDTVNFSSLEPPATPAAIIVPSYFTTTYPFSWEDRARMRRSLLQAYVLCIKAGIEADLVVETADLSKYQLLIAPSTQKLLAPTWEFMRRHAVAGNTVYWSYYGGDFNFHQGAWCHCFAELTGCEHQLRFGCYDLPPKELELHAVDGGDALDMRWYTEVGTAPYPRAYLPIQPIARAQTKILARDSTGCALITEVRHGAGHVIFSNTPFEYYLAEQADINECDSSERLYLRLAETAAIASPITSSCPAVQVRQAKSGESDLLWVINHSWNAQSTRITSPGGVPIHGATEALQSGATTRELAGKQVAVFKLNTSL